MALVCLSFGGHVFFMFFFFFFFSGMYLVTVYSITGCRHLQNFVACIGWISTVGLVLWYLFHFAGDPAAHHRILSFLSFFQNKSFSIRQNTISKQLVERFGESFMNICHESHLEDS